MADPIETAYLNTAPKSLDRVSETKPPREFGDEDKKFIHELKEREDNPHSNSEGKEEEEKNQDTYERESVEPENENQTPALKKGNAASDSEGPGMLIDVTV